MKIYLKYSILTLLTYLLFSRGNCISGAHNVITEVPYTKNITISGSGTSIEDTIIIDLKASYYYEMIKCEFMEIAYKTKSIKPVDLTGNISITVNQANGTPIFTTNVAGNKPSGHLINPYKLNITQTDVQLINAYLAIRENRNIAVIVKIDTQTDGLKIIEALIFIKLQVEYYVDSG